MWLAHFRDFRRTIFATDCSQRHHCKHRKHLAVLHVVVQVRVQLGILVVGELLEQREAMGDTIFGRQANHRYSRLRYSTSLVGL